MDFKCSQMDSKRTTCGRSSRPQGSWSSSLAGCTHFSRRDWDMAVGYSSRFTGGVPSFFVGHCAQMGAHWPTVTCRCLVAIGQVLQHLWNCCQKNGISSSRTSQKGPAERPATCLEFSTAGHLLLTFLSIDGQNAPAVLPDHKLSGTARLRTSPSAKFSNHASLCALTSSTL